MGLRELFEERGQGIAASQFFALQSFLRAQRLSTVFVAQNRQDTPPSESEPSDFPQPVSHATHPPPPCLCGTVCRLDHCPFSRARRVCVRRRPVGGRQWRPPGSGRPGDRGFHPVRLSTRQNPVPGPGRSAAGNRPASRRLEIGAGILARRRQGRCRARRAGRVEPLRHRRGHRSAPAQRPHDHSLEHR